MRTPLAPAVAARPEYGLRWECDVCTAHGGKVGACRLCMCGAMRPLLSTVAQTPYVAARR